MTITLLVALLAVGFLLTALCAGAETGFYAFSRVRHHLELERESAAARRLERLLARPNLLLAALLVGTVLALELVTYCTELLLERYSGLSAGARATAGAVVMTPILFVVAEALPKHAFLARPYLLLARCSLPLSLLVRVLSPLARAITAISVRVERAALGSIDESGAPAASASSGFESALKVGLREGLLTRSEHMLAANVLRLGSLKAADVAVPLSALPRLELPANRAAWRAAFVGQQETRALVHDPASRSVVGMVHALDLALAVEEGRPDLAEVMRPILTVPEETPIADLLGRMHTEGVALALVIGGKRRTQMLVRLQDLMGELFDSPPGS